MSKERVALLIEARRHLGLSQGKFGVLLGSSERTGQRWERRGASPSPSQLHQLAGLVYEHDPVLAERIAGAAGTTLLALGVVAPPPPPPAPAPAPPPPEYLVDAVVCAAAEAMHVMPQAIRPALQAAFRRARLVGLSLDVVDQVLHAPREPEEAGAASTQRDPGKG